MVRTARLAARRRRNCGAGTTSQVQGGSRTTIGKVLRSLGAISREPAGGCGATGLPFLTVLEREGLQNRALSVKNQNTIYTAPLRVMLRRK